MQSLHDSPVVQWRDREYRINLIQGRKGFWVLFILIFVIAALIRCYRLDMPPVDFPADRQRSNFHFIERIMEGSASIYTGRSWLEPQILPWITARTARLCSVFNCELWTLARCYSVLFSMLTLLLVAWSATIATAGSGASPAGGRRINLFFMAAVAFNPFHVAMARMILVEPLALMFQAAALVCLLRLKQDRKNYRWLSCTILMLLVAGLAKLPSLIWLPAFLLTVMFGSRLPLRARMTGLLLIVIAVVIIFMSTQINPFNLIVSFRDQFRVTFEAIADWFGTILWNRVYLSRVVLMLTLPGIFFIFIGLIRAPWVFHVTFFTALIGFYALVNLNVYNFCHLILPGMALAAWGMEGIFIMVSRTWNTMTTGGARAKRVYWLPRGGPVDSFVGTITCILLVVVLYPLGPGFGHESEPRPELDQVKKVIHENVAPGETVYNDDMQGSISVMLGNGFGNISKTPKGRYYYSIHRFDRKILELAATHWVHWANLPGEPNGVLFDRNDRAGWIPQDKVDPDQVQLNADPKINWTANQSHPSNTYNPETHILSIDRGTTFALELQLAPPRGVSLLGIRWLHQDLEKPVPVPIRTGGFSYMTGGVLCLQGNINNPAKYIFDIPEYFPTGMYRVQIYNIEQEWISPDEHSVRTLSSQIEVRDSGPPQINLEDDSINRLFRDVYPMVHHIQPTVWSPHRTYRNLVLQGYRLTGTKDHLFSCTGSPAGQYELIIHGEGTRSANLSAPRAQWPVAYVYLQPQKTAVAAKVFNSGDTNSFKLDFSADEPFDRLYIRTIAHEGSGGRLPGWMTDFVPSDYGRQHITLRKARLVYHGPVTMDVQADE